MTSGFCEAGQNRPKQTTDDIREFTAQASTVLSIKVKHGNRTFFGKVNMATSDAATVKDRMPAGHIYGTMAFMLLINQQVGR
ncbi:MAG TPA: hypothetical protein VFC63_14300 [Blastocatellia bacterium]|nr:hypothetical protein [Blastocatellia bacterium]